MNIAQGSGKFTALIAAGGTGARTGLTYPKQLYPLGGKTVIGLAAERLAACGCVDKIIVVSEKSLCGKLKALLNGNEKLAAIVGGADTRQGSVYNGLKRVDTEFVLIHDAARPFAGVELIERVARLTRENGACVPVIRPADSVKTLDIENALINGGLDRGSIGLAQTPQGFAAKALLAAYELAEGREFTDDAGIAANYGIPVCFTEGERSNIKITTEYDLAFAEFWAANFR